MKEFIIINLGVNQIIDHAHESSEEEIDEGKIRDLLTDRLPFEGPNTYSKVAKCGFKKENQIKKGFNNFGEPIYWCIRILYKKEFDYDKRNKVF